MPRVEIENLHPSLHPRVTRVENRHQQSKPPANESRMNVIVSGPEFFNTELRHCITQAKSTIDVQEFIFQDDEIGGPVYKELEEAAKRGVKVRILKDNMTWPEMKGLKSIIPTLLKYIQLRVPRLKRKLLGKNIPDDRLQIDVARQEGRFPILSALERDHTKSFVIDAGTPDAIAYIGGRNISNADMQSNDMMVRVTGEMVNNLKKDFTNAWDKRKKKDSPIFTDRDGNLLISDGRRSDKIMEELLTQISNAKRRVWIETPYYDFKIISPRLIQLAKEHPEVDIRVVTPYWSRNNHLLYKVLFFFWWKKLAREGIRVYGYGKKSKLFSHAKAALIDDIAVVGSSNYSESIFGGKNAEIGLFGRDKELVESTQAWFEDDFANSVLYPRGKDVKMINFI